MTTAYFFAILSLFLFLFLLYFLQLVFFYEKEMKSFHASGKEDSYLTYLSIREKKVKSKRKRNFLLYLRIQSHKYRGETEKAESLIPFVKKDRLFDI